MSASSFSAALNLASVLDRESCNAEICSPCLSQPCVCVLTWLRNFEISSSISAIVESLPSSSCFNFTASVSSLSPLPRLSLTLCLLCARSRFNIDISALSLMISVSASNSFCACTFKASPSMVPSRSSSSSSSVFLHRCSPSETSLARRLFSFSSSSKRADCFL